MDDQTVADATKVKQPEGDQKQVDTAAEKTVSKTEFDAVVSQRQELKEKLQKIKDSEAKAKEQKEIEEGNLKGVLAAKEAELLSLKAKADAYEAQQSKLRDSMIAKLPEDMKIFAEDIKDLDKLNSFVEKTTKQSAPDSSAEKKKLSAGDVPTFKTAHERGQWLIKQGLAQ